MVPASGDLKRSINVDLKKKLTRKVMFPNLVKLTEAAGFQYILTLEETSLTSLYASAKTITSTLVNIVRQLTPNGEYIMYTLVLKGTDENNQEVIGSGTVQTFGLDYSPEIKQVRNLDGDITKLVLGQKQTPIYTIPYSSEKVSEILNGNDYEVSPKLGLSITQANGGSWSGMSQLEFESLSSKELIWRCKNNHCNEDVDISFSELPTAQKLNLSTKK